LASLADMAIAATTVMPSINVTRLRMSLPPFANCTCAVLGQLESDIPQMTPELT
jgi:hypothetical protein